MYLFRRLIYGISQFLMVLWIIGATILGGAAPGLLTAILDIPLPPDSPLMARLHHFDHSGVAILFGSLAGFAVSALSSAVLFALIEIALNTRQLRSGR